MVLSLWGIIGISAVVGGLLSWAIVKCSKKLEDAKIAAGCMSFLILTFGVSVALAFTVPKVIVISSDSVNFDHKKKYALFSYHEHSVSFFKTYIDNQSEEPLVLYPIFYGTASASEEDSEEDVEIIPPGSVSEVAHEPEKFFYAPEYIYTKDKNGGKRIWFLETVNGAIKRESKMIDRRNQILNTILHDMP